VERYIFLLRSHDYKRDVLHPNKTQTRTCTCLHDDVICKQSMVFNIPRLLKQKCNYLKLCCDFIIMNCLTYFILGFFFIICKLVLFWQKKRDEIILFSSIMGGLGFNKRGMLKTMLKVWLDKTVLFKRLLHDFSWNRTNLNLYNSSWLFPFKILSAK
jgi:hypothetical protein